MLREFGMIWMSGCPETRLNIFSTMMTKETIILTNTTGIPPRTALDPSSADLDDTNNLSTGSAEVAEPDFQDTTVAP